MLPSYSLLTILILGELLSVVVTSPVSFRAELASSSGLVFQKGMTFWSVIPNYDSSLSDESLLRLRETNTEWVAIFPIWYQETIYSTEIYAKLVETPTKESLVHVINKAHELGMKVMLKPAVDPEHSRVGWWRGEIPPSEAWFQSYAKFIDSFADLAQEQGVEMLCVGCEFMGTISWKSSWESIISGVRERYSGLLTYAALVGDFQNITWWGSLDYVGIDAYFSLTEKNDPTFEELKQAWESCANFIEEWQVTVNKPVIFTEIGYRSGDGANREPWDSHKSLSVDLQEQVDCYEAAFQVLWDKSWFYGFYWFNWDTTPLAGGSWDSGYTPQNKPAENVVKSWYAKPRGVSIPTIPLTIFGITVAVIIVLAIPKVRHKLKRLVTKG